MLLALIALAALAQEPARASAIDVQRAEAALAELAPRLPERSAAVAYLSAPGAAAESEGSEAVPGERLLALVLRPDGALARIDLGPAAELEELVAGWREALGAGGPGRGSPRDEPRRGTALRERLLDPVLAAAGSGVRTLYVRADELVLLVPLDALPESGAARGSAKESARVGDRLRLVLLPSLGSPERASAIDPANRRLVLLGAVSYGAAGARSFRSLPGAARELDSVDDMFRHAFWSEETILRGAAATKAAFVEAAPGARYLHLATHVWFGDGNADDGERTDLGLAFAGANEGAGAAGRASGILGVEELAALDLSACSLAVLSACETKGGLRRAGQGIQSLLSALHAAGARTAVTSLWKVDDAATRELFEQFYLAYWFEKASAADALWKAKRILHERGAPVRDWAGWVLSGESD